MAIEEVKKIVLLFLVFVFLHPNIVLAGDPNISYQIIESNAGVGAYNASTGSFYFQANTSWNSNLPKLVSDGTYIYSLISMGDQATSRKGEQGLEIRRKRLNSGEGFTTIGLNRPGFIVL